MRIETNAALFNIRSTKTTKEIYLTMGAFAQVEKMIKLYMSKSI